MADAYDALCANESELAKLRGDSASSWLLIAPSSAGSRQSTPGSPSGTNPSAHAWAMPAFSG